MAESVAKLREQLLQLTGGKLDIQIDEKNFKSSFQILKELSEIWDEIGEKSGDVAQANILNLLGGKRNANVLSSIIKNFQDAIAAAETAGDSMGSAWAENEKYLNSIEGKTKQVEAAFQTFASSVIQSDVVKTFLDIQKSILNVATELNNVGALVPAIATVAAIVKTVKDAITAQKTTQTILSMIVGSDGDITAAVGKLAGLTNMQRQLVVNNLEIATSTGAVSGSVAAGATGVAAYASSMTSATGATVGFKGALESIKAAFATNPLGIALLAITAGIALIKKGIDSIAEASDKAIERSDEIRDAYDDANKTYDQNIDSLGKLRDRFEELNKKVGENGTQGKLTNDEYKEYMDIVKQIVAISPGLADHYTNVGEEIQGGYTNALKEAIEYQKQLLKYENDQYLAGGGTLFEGFAERYRKVRDQVKDLNNDLYESIGDAVNAATDYDADKASNLMDKISDLFRMSSGETLWDTKPLLSNLEEMMGYYENMDDLMVKIQSLTKEVTTESGQTVNVPMFDEDQIDDIRVALRKYAEAAKEFSAVKTEAFDYLYAYVKTDLNSLFDQIPIERLGEFKELMKDAMDPTATLESNKGIIEKFTKAYVEALRDIRRAEDVEDIGAYVDELAVKYQYYPTILKMVKDALLGVKDAQDDVSSSASEVTKTYEDIAGAISNIDKISSFWKDVNDAESKDTLKLLETAQEFSKLINEAGGDITPGNLFDVAANGSLDWDISKVKELTEWYIRLQFAGSELEQEHPEAIDAIVNGVLKLQDAAESVISFSEAMSAISKTDEVWHKISSGADLTDEEIVGLLGDLQDFTDQWNKIRGENEQIDLSFFVGYENGEFDFSKTANKVMDFRRAMLAASPAVQALESKFPGITKELIEIAPSLDDASESAYTFKDAMSVLSSVKDTRIEGFDLDNIEDSVQKADDLATKWNEILAELVDDGDAEIQQKTWRDFFDIDPDGKLVEKSDAIVAMYTDAIEAVVNSIEGLSEEEKEYMKQGLLDQFISEQDAKNAEDRADRISESLDKISSAFGYLESHTSGTAVGADFFDALEEFENLRTKFDEGWNFSDFFEWDDSISDFKYKTAVLESELNKQAESIAASITQSMVDAGKINSADYEDVYFEVLDSFKNRWKKTSTETFDDINDVISQIKEVSDFSETVESFGKGETSIVDMFSSAISMAEEFGLTMEDVWNFDKMQPKMDDVYDALNKAIDKLAQSRGLSETFATQLKDAARAEKEIQSAQSSINESYDKFISLSGDLSNLTRDNELTFKEYQELIDNDTRYANAIEYINGQLTVNKQKYAEITQAIGEENLALAEQRIAQIRNSEEYQKYSEEFERLGDKMDSAHLKELQNLEVEIRGYQVLASEIRNASDEFSRFLNASDATSGKYFNAAESAKQIIEDTVYNEGSGRYHKYGNEKYQLAFDLLIGENVEVNTKEFDDAMETINRYLTGTEEGYNNFVNDLMDQGIIDANGRFSSSIKEMADALGVTEGLVRAMLEEAQEYNETEFDWFPFGIGEAEQEAEKTKDIFETIQDVSNAIDDLKGNKMDVGAGEAAGAVSNVNAMLTTTLALLREINAIGINFNGGDGSSNGMKDRLGQNFIPDWYNGNVDLVNRKIVSPEMMIKVGFEFEGEYGALFSKNFNGHGFNLEGAESDMTISVTPITPDGKILTPAELSQYVQDLFNESMESGKSVKDIDAGKYNLLIDVESTDAETSIEQAMQKAIEKMKEINDLQKGWDELRSRLNLTDGGAEASGALSDVTSSANEAQSAVSELGGTSPAVNTSGAVSNLNSVSSAAKEAAGAVDGLNGKSATVSVNLVGNIGGINSGNAGPINTISKLFPFLSGWSNAGGTHGLSRGGQTLVGELGREIVVDTDNGQWYTVGNKGPEFINLPNNSIVFSNYDTEQILRTRKGASAKGGRAHAKGTTDISLKKMAENAAKYVKFAAYMFSGQYDKVEGLMKPTTKNKKKNNSVQDMAAQVTALKDAFEALNKEYEHYIAHQEQSYYLAERASDYTGMREALENEAAYYKKIYDEAMSTVDQMIAQGADDTNEDLQAVEESAWDAYQSMYEAYDKIRDLLKDALKDEVDNIQSSFNNLNTAITQYNDTGHITIDTLQSILEDGIQYLSFLRDEEGQLKINKESVQKLLNARKEQLSIEYALSYISRIKEAAQNGEVETLDSLVDATNDLASSTWDLVDAQAAELLESGLVTEEQYDQIADNIEALKELTDIAEDDLGDDEEETIEDIKNKYEALNEEINHYIEHLEYAQKVSERFSDYHGITEAIEGQITEYKQILENANQAVEEMKAKGADDTTEELQDMEEAAWSAQESIWSLYDTLYSLRVDAITERIDSITDSISDFETAMGEINESGTMSVDTFQKLLENGLQYLQFIEVENGQLSINEDAVQDMIRAKKEQLAVETAMSYLNQVEEAVLSGQNERIRELVDLTESLSESTWAAVDAKLALLQTEGLSTDDAEKVKSYIDKLKEITKVVSVDVTTDTEKTLEETLDEILDQFNEIKEDLEHYIAHQEQAFIENERALDFNGMVSVLNNEVDYYKRIYEEAQKAVNDMIEAGADDTTKELQEAEEAAWEAFNNINTIFDKINALRVDALKDELASIKGAFSSLKSAADEYNETGRMTLDTFTSIAEGGMQYLTLLDREGDQYVISKKKVAEYVAARKGQLAIETALSYIANIRDAALNGETERIDSLVNATNELSSGTWNLVYAQAAALKAAGLSDKQYDVVMENIEKLKVLAMSANDDLTAASDKVTDSYESQKDALDQILKFTEDLIKAEANDRIDAINEEIDAYKKVIELKKESLKATKDENDYQNEVADKIKEIAKLQSKADLLALDTSRAANAERQRLLQEIQDKQNDLSDYQADHAYEAQTEALDKEAEAYEESMQDRIKEIEESVSSEEKVYQLAIERIRDKWSTLYADLIDWNTEQGSVINQEITDAWEAAAEAVKKYGSYLKAVTGIQESIEGKDKGENLVVADIPKYHGGGVAGKKGELNDNEILAVLEKDELIIDREQKKGLYTVVDFVKSLGERLGTTIGSLRNLNIAGAMTPAFAGMTAAGSAGMIENNNVTFSPTFSVNINGEVGDMATAREYGRTIADTAANNLFEAFTRRGINTVHTLRQ